VKKIVEKAAAEKPEPVAASGAEKEKKAPEARAANLMAALEASLARAKGQMKRRKSA
jgi:hypothetical protein